MAAAMQLLSRVRPAGLWSQFPQVLHEFYFDGCALAPAHARQAKSCMKQATRARPCCCTVEIPVESVPDRLHFRDIGLVLQVSRLEHKPPITLGLMAGVP